MADLWRAFMQIFGVRYVWLIDFNGSKKVARVEFKGGMPFARRFGYDIANVYLHDNGVVSGVDYVTRWEPYDPNASGKYPEWAS